MSKSFYGSMTMKRAIEIRRMYFDQRIKQREIAETFGITQGSVSRIISGKVWAEKA